MTSVPSASPPTQGGSLSSYRADKTREHPPAQLVTPFLGTPNGGLTESPTGPKEIPGISPPRQCPCLAGASSPAFASSCPQRDGKAQRPQCGVQAYSACPYGNLRELRPTLSLQHTPGSPASSGAHKDMCRPQPYKAIQNIGGKTNGKMCSRVDCWLSHLTTQHPSSVCEFQASTEWVVPLCATLSETQLRAQTARGWSPALYFPLYPGS